MREAASDFFNFVKLKDFAKLDICHHVIYPKQSNSLAPGQTATGPIRIILTERGGSYKCGLAALQVLTQ